jgi:hypothetical protein
MALVRRFRITRDQGLGSSEHWRHWRQFVDELHAIGKRHRVEHVAHNAREIDALLAPHDGLRP